MLALKTSVMFLPSLSIVIFPLAGGMFKAVPERRIYLGANFEYSGSCLGLFCMLMSPFKKAGILTTAKYSVHPNCGLEALF